MEYSVDVEILHTTYITYDPLLVILFLWVLLCLIILTYETVTDQVIWDHKLIF